MRLFTCILWCCHIYLALCSVTDDKIDQIVFQVHELEYINGTGYDLFVQGYKEFRNLPIKEKVSILEKTESFRALSKNLLDSSNIEFRWGMRKNRLSYRDMSPENKALFIYMVLDTLMFDVNNINFGCLERYMKIILTNPLTNSRNRKLLNNNALLPEIIEDAGKYLPSISILKSCLLNIPDSDFEQTISKTSAAKIKKIVQKQFLTCDDYMDLAKQRNILCRRKKFNTTELHVNNDSIPPYIIFPMNNPGEEDPRKKERQKKYHELFPTPYLSGQNLYLDF